MSAPVYRFGPYRIAPFARELQNAGELVVLSPKVFDCLAYLIAHRDRAVGRDELIAAVWGKSDVSDTLLGQTVLKARRAVGDTGNEQNAIRTVPRFGYRWVGALAVDDAVVVTPAARPPRAADDPLAMDASTAVTTTAVASGMPATISPAATPHRANRIAALAVAGVLAVFAGWQWQAAHHPATADAPAEATTPADETIAVLPVDVDGGEEWGWLRLGLMDMIATRLRRGGLPVVPSDNVVALSRAAAATSSEDAVRFIRGRAGARYALMTRLVRNGSQWQVRFELVAGDGSRREVQSQGDEPVAAARTASDRLLALLGQGAPEDAGSSGNELPMNELLQRVEAALLGDDFAGARRLIEAAPQAQREAPAVRLRLAQIDFRSGRSEQARATLETLLAAVPGESDPVLRARIVQTLGAIDVRDARNSDAIAAFEESIALTETRREPSVLGKGYAGLAIALMDAHRYDEAADALARARIALSLAGDALALAGVDDNEGLLDNARGRPADALPAFQRAADTLRRFGVTNDLALVTAAQIDTQLSLLDATAALAASDAFLGQRAALTNPRSRNSFDIRRARALMATGRLAAARTVLYELRRAPAAESQAGLLGFVATLIAELDLAAGNTDAAQQESRQALEGLSKIEQADVCAEAWLTLLRAQRAGGRLADAGDELARFTRWSAEHAGAARVVLMAALAQAEQTQARARTADSWHGYDDALAQAERRGVPDDIALVVVSYGNALIDANDLDRAAAVIGRVTRWAEQDFDCALLQSRLYHALGESDAWQQALRRARALAGERVVPASLTTIPAPAAPALH